LPRHSFGNPQVLAPGFTAMIGLLKMSGMRERKHDEKIIVEDP
jgi:hypothetical protein